MPTHSARTSPIDHAASAPVIRIQSIIYNLERERAVRAVEFIDNAARLALGAGIAARFDMAIGDCSPQATFDAVSVQALQLACKHLNTIDVTFFGANLGSAAGHNRLLAQNKSDFTLIMNPDVLVTPSLFAELLAAHRRGNVGLAEARQMPVEHQKDFDTGTGATSWSSTACLLAKTRLLHDLGGFDADTFFLYCDDVDLSWRARLAGFDVVYQPTAVCFHDKRLSDQAGWISGAAERYYSAEASLLLTHKYSRPDLCETYLTAFRASSDPNLLKAAAEFDARKAEGRLPAPIDADHKVAQFIDGAYAKHRFHAR